MHLEVPEILGRHPQGLYFSSRAWCQRLMAGLTRELLCAGLGSTCWESQERAPQLNMNVQTQTKLAGLDSRDTAYTPHLMSSSRLCALTERKAGTWGHVAARSPRQKAETHIVRWGAAEVGPATAFVTLGSHPLILP